MKGKRIALLIVWLIALAITIFHLIMGAGWGLLVADCLALASPLIVYLTSRR